MERVQKGSDSRDSASSKRVAQGKAAPRPAQGGAAPHIDGSPYMTAQRQKLQSLFGGAAQLQGQEDSLLQGKFKTTQRAEDEESLQGKFEAAQRVEEEDTLQGKFEAVQRVEDEEPLQGKFEAAQRVEEEELLQGKFDAVQRVEDEEPLQGKFDTAQRVEDEEPLQGKFDTAQRVEDEEPLQGKFASAAPAQLKQQPAETPNNTGLPDNLKSGIESLSGISMDHVKVHYNSSQPAQLNALAYAQGTDIHVAPGQEQHLPHEAWHVVQQAQGRVKPTMQMKEGVPVNDDKGLETEADVMGAKALVRGVAQFVKSGSKTADVVLMNTVQGSPQAMQRETHTAQLMKWTSWGGKWFPDDESTTNPVPAQVAKKDGERFDDGIGPVVLTLPPMGGVLVTASFGGTTAYLINPNNLVLGKVALDQLINVAHGGGGQHRSKKMEGGSTDTYIHPNDDELVTYSCHGKHTDGIPIIKIYELGKVRGGVHKF